MRRVSSDAADPGDRGPGDCPGDPGGPDRPAPGGPQTAAPNGLRHRQRRALRAAARRGGSGGGLGESWAHASAGGRVSVRERLFSDPEYTFKHALTHEVTYGTLLQERRKELQARIVSAIERCYPDRLTEHVERLAHHAMRGEMWELAVTYLRHAGAKAFARSANREAVACFEQALTALARLPETRETLQQAIDVRFELRNPLFALGELEGVVGRLRDADGLARILDDPRRLGWVSMYISSSLWVTGHPTEARVYGERGSAIAEALEDVQLGSLYGAKGEFSHAVQLLERALVLSREWNLTLLLPSVTGSLGSAYVRSGRVAEGLSLLQQALTAYETIRLGHYHSLVVSYLGEAYVLTDRLQDALASAKRALTMTRQRGERGYEAWALRLLGEITARRGPSEHADGHYRDALALAEELGMRPLIAHCHLGLGKLYRRTGTREQAQESLTTAKTMYLEMGMTYWLEKVRRRAWIEMTRPRRHNLALAHMDSFA